MVSLRSFSVTLRCLNAELAISFLCFAFAGRRLYAFGYDQSKDHIAPELDTRSVSEH